MSKIKYVSSSGLTHYDEKIKKVIDKVDTSTNTKVTQTPTSTDASYPLLLSPSGQTQETNTTSYFNSGVVLNPSTKTISANIDGNAETATSADSATKATKDGAGNVITDTYAEKETIALKSATGASISIADSKESPMILNYAPVNLFSHTFETTTINGITFTANADGTITANGTATGVDIHCPVGTYTFTENDIGKTFVWSDNGATYADWNGGPRIYIDGINGISGRQMFSKFSIEKAHTVRVYIRVVKNAVVENSVLRPVLEEGSTYHTYVPCTGYDIASCGKNLIGRVPKSTSGTRCSVEWNGDDVTVTSTVSNNWIGYSCGVIGLKPNTKYTISAEVEASTTNIYNGIQFGNKIKFNYGLSGTVTLTDTTDANGYIYILFLVDNKGGGSSGDYAIFKNIMLEEGDTASGYEASKSTSVTINSETVFPVNGLESYDGLTNVLNPYSATMEVTYATNEAGQGILKEIKTKAEINGSNAIGDWDIDITGNSATSTKATQDGNGNVITDTYAKKSIYGDTVVSMGRKADTTVGTNSFAFGDDVTASGVNSFATGYNNVASGGNSHASGSNSTASGTCSHACGVGAIALTNQLTCGHWNDTSTAKENTTYGTTTGSAFVIGNGGGSGTTSNAFRVTGEGLTIGLKAYQTGGADFSEFREWLDGNSENEDRVGYFVTMQGLKIKKANAGDYIRGVVSGNPCIIGNGDECWMGRYVLDDFGRFIYEEVEEIVKIIDENGKEKEETITVRKMKENPEYDNTKEYTPRSDRDEWATVGMVGRLPVRDDGTCQIDGFCKVADGGIATYADWSEGSYQHPVYRVVNRVTENIVEIEI